MANIKYFDGITLHPSLDIKEKILIIGFSYRTNELEVKDAYLIAMDGAVSVTYDDLFEYEDSKYWIDKGKRKLVAIDDKWSARELFQFVEDMGDPKKIFIPDRKDIFEEIFSLAKRYVSLSGETDYLLFSAWIIATYFSPAFSAFPFLNLKAPKHSGKTQCLNFLNQTTFNAIKARPTVAAFGDVIDARRGAYLIDQGDILWGKNNGDLLDLLVDSYKKTGGNRMIVNVTKNKQRELLEFNTYGPKAIASINDLPEDLRDRCLIIPLIRSGDNFFDPCNEHEQWRDIRGRLYKFTVGNYQTISNTYEILKMTYRSSKEVVGRDLELWLPLETILTQSVDQSDIESAKKRFLSQYKFSEHEPSELEEIIIRSIIERCHNKGSLELSTQQILDEINVDLFRSQDLKQRSSEIGRIIKRYNLASEKTRAARGIYYVFKLDWVEKIYESYFRHTSHTRQPNDVMDKTIFDV